MSAFLSTLFPCPHVLSLHVHPQAPFLVVMPGKEYGSGINFHLTSDTPVLGLQASCLVSEPRLHVAPLQIGQSFLSV